ncbi:MAG: hypothetical protein GY953_38760 [bacterium]|nr:hypothetical protein [bacterium]
MRTTLHLGQSSSKFRTIERNARTPLVRLHAATNLADLAAIRGNSLE